MRQIMFENKTDCAIFIGGMNGIIEEAKLIHNKHSNAKLLTVANTGGACADLARTTDFSYDSLSKDINSYAYVHLFVKYLKQFTK